jgi:excisionase family DNA binding protein
MTAQEAAEILDVSEKHVIRALQDGAFPGFKFRDTYRVLRAFVEDLVAAAANGFVNVDDFSAARSTKAEGAA